VGIAGASQIGEELDSGDVEYGYGVLFASKDSGDEAVVGVGGVAISRGVTITRRRLGAGSSTYSESWGFLWRA
jgi:hypothetical protein